MNRSTYIADNSRFKDTYLYPAASSSERPQLGLWVRPAELDGETSAWREHTVRVNEVGFLDIIAVAYFGPGMETYGWLIAGANGIINADMDMFAGQRLRIPPASTVRQFIGRASNAE